MKSRVLLTACLLTLSSSALALQKEGSFEGRVVDSKHKPVAGVRVMAQIQNRHMSGSQMPERNHTWSETISGADGKFVLKGLGPYSYNVALEEKSGRKVAAAKEGAESLPGKTTGVGDLVLTGGGTIEVQVVDIASRLPVKNVPVGCYGPHRPRSSAMIISARTDSHGRCSLRVPPGDSYVYVAHENYAGQGQGLTIKVVEAKRSAAKLKVSASDFVTRRQ
jgi:hypothetical protein